MSRPAPRRNQNHQQTNNNNIAEHNNHPIGPHSHSHGSSHARTRSRQLQQQHQQHHHPQRQPITSDYESDTPQQQQRQQQQQQQQHQHQHQQVMASRDHVTPSAALAGRTNTELNLTVLGRYVPSITSILSIAANAVVYTFQPPSEWRRTNVEGTLFICSQRKPPGDAGETGCLFVLNRKGLQNLVLDLDTIGDFELAGDLLIFKLDYAAHEVHLDNGEPVRPLVLGLWTYAEDESDRETNATLINDMWSQALSTRDARARAAASHPATAAALAEGGPAAQAAGRRLSVSELFSTYNGNTMPAPAQ